MTLQLRPDMSIAELQKQFALLFPYLKIIFFTVPHKEGGSVWSKFQVFDTQKKIGDVSHFEEVIIYELSPILTTGAFEQDWQERFGLFIQVFRQSKDVWLATSSSDSWTLIQQNQVGNESAHTTTQMIYETRSLDDMD